MTADNSLTVTLSKPLASGKGPINEFTLREPTLRDLKKAGGSFIITKVSYDEDNHPTISTDHDPFRLAALVSELSGVDAITLDDLPAVDAARIARALAPALTGM